MIEKFSKTQMEILEDYIQYGSIYSTVEEFKATFEKCKEVKEHIGNLVKQSYYKYISKYDTTVFLSVIYYNDKPIFFITGCNTYDYDGYVETGYITTEEDMVIYTYFKGEIPTFTSINKNNGEVKKIKLNEM